MTALPPLRPVDATAVIGGRGSDATYAVAFALASEGRGPHAPHLARALRDTYPVRGGRIDWLARRRLRETGFVVLTRAQFERCTSTGLAARLEGRRRPVALSVPAVAFARALARADAFGDPPSPASAGPTDRR